jgi:hypothetical protein
VQLDPAAGARVRDPQRHRTFVRGGPHRCAKPKRARCGSWSRAPFSVVVFECAPGETVACLGLVKLWPPFSLNGCTHLLLFFG